MTVEHPVVRRNGQFRIRRAEEFDHVRRIREVLHQTIDVELLFGVAGFKEEVRPAQHRLQTFRNPLIAGGKVFVVEIPAARPQLKVGNVADQRPETVETAADFDTGLQTVVLRHVFPNNSKILPAAAVAGQRLADDVLSQVLQLPERLTFTGKFRLFAGKRREERLLEVIGFWDGLQKLIDGFRILRERVPFFRKRPAFVKVR